MIAKYGKTDLITEIAASTTDVTRKQVETVVEAALTTIEQRVAGGKVVTIPGFGTWQQAQRQARMGTNLRTKEKIQIPASIGVRFSAGSAFKTAVAGKTMPPAAYAKERAAGGKLEERVRQKVRTRGEKRRG